MRIKDRDQNSPIEKQPDDHIGVVSGRKDADPDRNEQLPISVNPRTGRNLQNDRFNEIGRVLEGDKDSPMDKLH
jgi:hypothetical protein